MANTRRYRETPPDLLRWDYLSRDYREIVPRLKQHPRPIPYEELPGTEKDYDRMTSMETIRLIPALKT